MAESKPIDISSNADLDEPAQAENESPLPMRERAKRLLWSALAFPRSILVASTARAISYLPLPVITAAAIGVIVGATTTWGLSRTTPARATLISDIRFGGDRCRNTARIRTDELGSIQGVATATSMCKVTVTSTGRHPSRHCPTLVLSNRSNGRMAAGWW